MDSRISIEICTKRKKVAPYVLEYHVTVSERLRPEGSTIVTIMASLPSRSQLGALATQFTQYHLGASA